VYGAAINYLASDRRFQFLYNASLKYPNYLTFDERISTGACDGEKMMYAIPHVLSLLKDPECYDPNKIIKYKPNQVGSKNDSDEDKARKRELKLPPVDKFTQASIEAVAFLISHELMHAELGHFFRMETFIDPNDKVGRKRCNFALDHEINTMLTVMGLPFPDVYVLYIGNDLPYPRAKLTGNELFEEPEARVTYEALRDVSDSYFEDDKHDQTSGSKQSKLSKRDERLDEKNQKQKQQDKQSGQQKQQGGDQQNKEQQDKEQQNKEQQDKEQQAGGKQDKEQQNKDKKSREQSGKSGNDETEQSSNGTDPTEPLNDIGKGFSGDPIVDTALDKIEYRKKQMRENLDEKMKADQAHRDAMQRITKALHDAGTDISRKLASLFGAKLIQATRASSTWKRLLRSFLAATNKREVSWSRLDRRFIAYRMYFPKIKDEQISLSIGFDTSGSMDIKDMQAFMVEIEKIMRLFSNRYVIIVHLFHDQVYESMVFNERVRYSASSFAAWIDKNRRTDGGTDFTEVVEAIVNDSRGSKYKTLGGIIFTDGFGGYAGDAPKTKIIWCLVGDGSGQLPGISWGLRVRFDPPKNDSNQ
jgi:predicted metal-dependent peptidase